MIEDNDVINPEEWTTKELVKHIYRELKKIEEKLTSLESDVSELRDDMKARKAIEQDQTKREVRLVGLTAVVIAALTLFLDFVFGIFK